MAPTSTSSAIAHAHSIFICHSSVRSGSRAGRGCRGRLYLPAKTLPTSSGTSARAALPASSCASAYEGRDGISCGSP